MTMRTRTGLVLLALLAESTTALAHEGHAHDGPPSATERILAGLGEHWPAIALVGGGMVIAVWLALRLRRQHR